MSTRHASRTTRKILAFSFLLAMSVWSVSWAQNENETVGFQTNHYYASDVFGENIDILNGGVGLTVPIGPKYQVSGSLAYQVTLHYTSKVWDHQTYSGTGADYDIPIRRSSAGLGFSLGFGRVYRDVRTVLGVSGNTSRCTWYYVSQDGNEHRLPTTHEGSCTEDPTGYTQDTTYSYVSGFPADTWNGDPASAPTLILLTGDGHLRYEFGHIVQVYNGSTAYNTRGFLVPGNNDPASYYNHDFGGWYVTKISDLTTIDTTHPHGRRWVQFAYDQAPGREHVIASVTDSSGRTITFTNTCEPDPNTVSKCKEFPVGNNAAWRASVRTRLISVPMFKGDIPERDTYALYEIVYTYDTLSNPDFTCTGDSLHCPEANLLHQVVFPTFTTHAGLQAGYTMTFGYDPFGELDSRLLPTGQQSAIPMRPTLTALVKVAMTQGTWS